MTPTPTPPVSPDDLPGLPNDVAPLPTTYTEYRWGWAPKGLVTRRQLRALGLRPGGQQPIGEIRWARGERVAYLYRLAAARPKRTPTPAQLAALAAAMKARRTCAECGRDAGYCLPTDHHLCIDCYYEHHCGRAA